MPKMKTRRAAAKRFSFTAKGKVKRSHAFAAHIKTKKSAKRIRGLRKSDLVAAVDVPRIKRMLNG